MAIEYSITIDSARVHTQGDLTDVVKQLEVTMVGTESGSSFSLPFTVDLGPADEEQFSPFGSLTQEQMVEWVWAQEETVNRYKAHIELIVNREVEKAQLVQKPLPWMPTPPSGSLPLTQN